MEVLFQNLWIILVVVIALIAIFKNVKVVQQAKAYVIERLGAYSATWGVGIHIKVPFIERVARQQQARFSVASFRNQRKIVLVLILGLFGSVDMHG